MALDDSFKKPGAIPFKWEIRPGVPKLQQPAPRSTSPSNHLHRSLLGLHQQKQTPNNHSRSSHPLIKLRPPPAEIKLPTSEPKLQVDSPVMARPEVVEFGCFNRSRTLKRKDDKKRIVRSKPKLDSDYEMDIATLSPRWSESTHKSFSVVCNSPLSSTYSSYQSSPCLFSDPEWVGFGLF